MLCQYKNIYTSLHKYLKGKKKKKKKTIAIVAIVPLGIVVTDQDLRKKKMCLTKPKHCSYNVLKKICCVSITIYIYTSLHKYLKKKKTQTDYWGGKKL